MNGENCTIFEGIALIEVSACLWIFKQKQIVYNNKFMEWPHSKKIDVGILNKKKTFKVLKL